MHRILAWIKNQWHRLLTVQDAPHAVAGGVAVGIIVGFTPLYSVKTLLAILLAWLCRSSKLSAVIVVTLYDLLLPLEPLLLHWQYALGHWLLASPHAWPAPMKSDDLFLHWREWFHASTFTTVIWPTVVGSLVFSIPIAAATYYPMLCLIRRVRRQREGEGAQDAKKDAQAEAECGSHPARSEQVPAPPENRSANPREPL